ncbi:(d)CMP kinase [Kibdelosporangium philippinense]|uniref:Cytidylate kinase n=1 Tax=Kibdelosporangium philippinense TaxID=211113 RepID=A0ABS8ZM43_9PSEU|nr:(d)CMP kinase [Kibdelosporangium philippinense]MCE7008587.1 (d)CMP kinase [Kibdelosporangium philippinense]
MVFRTPVIAIDGPAAAGKTTVSKAISDKLGIGYVESGRTYRLVAYHAIREHVPLTDEHALTALCHRMLSSSPIALYQTDAATARALRSPSVTRAVSVVAKLPGIRTAITDLTRKIVEHIGPAIVEGRDIGTAVFPNATTKIFLSATAEVRAKRRNRQEPDRGYAEILADINRRDELDRDRQHSPMTPAPDATQIDTTGLTVDEVISKVEAQCRLALTEKVT